MSASDFNTFLSQIQKQVQDHLDLFLGKQTSLAPELRSAMRYSVLNGGKRIRPALVYAACEAMGAPRHFGDAAAGAVELIHCYSLVHDDLPCMDNDDLRRGQPTCHRKYGEDTALLAGDALQTLAFGLLTETPANPDTLIRMIRRLSESAFDMAVGQALDLDAEGKQISLQQLETVHRNKTGALIRASLALGAMASGSADDATLSLLETFGDRLGLAFQVQDDVLDVIGDTATLGKQAGADAALQKATYPSLLGLNAAVDLTRKLHDEAIATLEPLGPRGTRLRELTDYLVSRTH